MRSLGGILMSGWIGGEECESTEVAFSFPVNYDHRLNCFLPSFFSGLYSSTQTNPPFLLQTVSNEVHWEIMRGRKFPPFQKKFAPQYILWNRQGWKCQDKGWNNLHTHTLKLAFSDSKVNPCCEILPKYFWQKRKEGAASQQVNTKLLTTQMWRALQTYSENFVEN